MFDVTRIARDDALANLRAEDGTLHGGAELFDRAGVSFQSERGHARNCSA
jgi:hypothetical protein